MPGKFSVAVALCMLPGVPAPPGKSTVSSDHALESMAFNLKYLPVTVAEDNGVGDQSSHDDTEIQGRVQVLNPKSYTERNCQLFSKLGDSSSASKYTSMTSNGQAKACSYSKGKQYSSGTELHKVFAYNQAQCCNACVATDGCIGASFLTSSNDHSGGFGPQTWEGFGIHITDVSTSKTTGGIPVSDLEDHFQLRLGDHKSYDQFMDYSVTFFTATLQPYIDAFTNDSVPHLVAQWETDDKDTWYSVIFLVKSSHYVIELVSHEKPSTASDLPQLEQRMSPAHVAKFKSYSKDPVNLLYISSVNRAASNMTAVDAFEVGLLKATSTHKLDQKDVTRRCYLYKSSSGPMANFDEELCFTARTPDADKDKIFSVLGFEQMLWSVHAAVLKDDPTNTADKYTDNHYAMPIPQDGLNALSSYFNLNSVYPITKDTRLAYNCKQSYIITPTGWSIQPMGMASWPDCGEPQKQIMV